MVMFVTACTAPSPKRGGASAQSRCDAMVEIGSAICAKQVECRDAVADAGQCVDDFVARECRDGDQAQFTEDQLDACIELLDAEPCSGPEVTIPDACLQLF